MARPRTVGTELSRKITIATVSGGPGKWFEKLMVAKDLVLMSVYGFATGAKAGVSDFGEFVKISGNFRAVNAETGEIHNAPQLILPNFLGEAIMGVLNSPERQGPMQFAFKIGVRYDVTVATKYKYYFVDVMPPQANDPLSALGNSLGLESAPQLEAPKPTPQATPEPTAAPVNHKRK